MKNSNICALSFLASVVINPMAASQEYKEFKSEVFVMNEMPAKRARRSEPTAADIAEVESWMNTNGIGKE